MEPVLIAIPEPPIKPEIQFAKSELEGQTIYYLSEYEFRQLGRYINDMQTYTKKLDVYLKKYYNEDI